MHLGILVLQATTVYPESFIILILFCIYRVSCVRPYFPSLQHSDFIALPENESKQWQHLFFLSLSQRVLLVMLLLGARHDEHASKHLSQFLEVVPKLLLPELIFFFYYF